MRNDEELPSINFAPTAYIAELDFVSQFPSIMARFNIAPETVNRPCCPEAPRIRAFALWEGWFGYDRKKYAAMLRDAFEPFVLCLPKTAEENLLNDLLTEEELKRFPLFAALALPHPLKV
jgi:DNA polymerase elongation subunit (family B)